MGSALGCFRAENSDEELRSGNCSFCLQWSIEPLINMFQRPQTRISPLRISIPNPNPNPNSSDADLDTYISPPRPLAYDDPRCSHAHVALSRAASKAASPAGSFGHVALSRAASKAESPAGSFGHVALSRAANKAESPTGSFNSEFGSVGTKKGESWYGKEFEEKGSVPVGEFDEEYYYEGESEEEENDCPICLEEYTEENPKMELQCNHDFHLSCIYEWMERSEACPVCGKVMLFDENA